MATLETPASVGTDKVPIMPPVALGVGGHVIVVTGLYPVCTNMSVASYLSDR